MVEAAGWKQSAPDVTIDGNAKSLARFEEARARDFKRFHREQAIAFNARFTSSKATVPATMRDLRSFFSWLAREPGFSSQIAYADADSFNLPDKDVAVGAGKRDYCVVARRNSAGMHISDFLIGPSGFCYALVTPYFTGAVPANE